MNFILLLVSLFIGFLIGWFGMFLKMKKSLEKVGLEVTISYFEGIKKKDIDNDLLNAKAEDLANHFHEDRFTHFVIISYYMYEEFNEEIADKIMESTKVRLIKKHLNVS